MFCPPKTALHQPEPAVRAAHDRGGRLPADNARAEPSDRRAERPLVRKSAAAAADGRGGGGLPADERVAAQGGARRHHRRGRLPAHEHLVAFRRLHQHDEPTRGAAADVGHRGGRHRQPAVPRAARPQALRGALERLPLGARLAQPVARRAEEQPLPERGRRRRQ
jgi:hypothetical protein